jgi:copper(I)-binding protein
VNRLDIRRASVTRTGLAVGALVVATALSGCGAGQISQTATQEPAVNGTSGTTKNITLRNVHIQAVQKGDALEPGQHVDLMFVASNMSADKADKLVKITSDVGTVSITGSTTVPPNGVLIVGNPDGVSPLSAVEGAEAGDASVTLNKKISNGLTYNFTFTFANAGDAKLSVPISAGAAPRQESPLEAQ